MPLPTGDYLMEMRIGEERLLGVHLLLADQTRVPPPTPPRWNLLVDPGSRPVEIFDVSANRTSIKVKALTIGYAVIQALFTVDGVPEDVMIGVTVYDPSPPAAQFDSVITIDNYPAPPEVPFILNGDDDAA